MAPIRILLVEDFEPFRRVVRTILQSRTDLAIVAEAVDGLEAIELADLLKPDVVLMDVGLPKRNGISAGKQIALDCPDSKLLFVSLEASPETVQAAFSIGAQGYVQKLSIDSDLIPAIDAILAGRQYIGSDIELANTSKEQSRHEILFYSDDSAFLANGVRFLRAALESDGAAVAIVTAPHGQGLIERLESEGFDMDGEIRRGRYTSLEVGEFLAKVAVNGVLDLNRVSRVLGDAVRSALKARKTEHGRVAIVGESSGVLCAKGDINGAIQLETNGIDTVDTRSVDILCPYPRSAFEQAEATDSAYQKICAAHTAVLA